MFHALLLHRLRRPRKSILETLRLLVSRDDYGLVNLTYESPATPDITCMDKSENERPYIGNPLFKFSSSHLDRLISI